MPDICDVLKVDMSGEQQDLDNALDWIAAIRKQFADLYVEDRHHEYIRAIEFVRWVLNNKDSEYDDGHRPDALTLVFNDCLQQILATKNIVMRTMEEKLDFTFTLMQKNYNIRIFHRQQLINKCLRKGRVPLVLTAACTHLDPNYTLVTQANNAAKLEFQSRKERDYHILTEKNDHNFKHNNNYYSGHEYVIQFVCDELIEDDLNCITIVSVDKELVEFEFQDSVLSDITYQTHMTNLHLVADIVDVR